MNANALLPAMLLLTLTGCSLTEAHRGGENPGQTPAREASSNQFAAPDGLSVGSRNTQTSTPRELLASDGHAIRPGQCWVQAVVHPRPVEESLNVVVRDPVNAIDVMPARLDKGRMDVVMREGGVNYRIEPPVYKQVTEKIEVRPEVRRSVVVPAQFKDVQEEIEIEAERTVLERCRVAGVRTALESAVQPLCARTIPAKTQNVHRRILAQPETVREEVEPAQYKEVTRWVLERPAQAIPVVEEPTTQAMNVQVISQTERLSERNVPAEIQQLRTTRFEGEPSVVLRQAVCDQDLNAPLVKSLQTALREQGFDTGPVDGLLGRRTAGALLEYQRRNGLAAGALTHESLEKLGLKPQK